MKLIRKNSISEFYEKKSRFIGYAFHVTSKEEADEILSELWKEHRKATHICTAIQLGLSDKWSDFDDNGEPSLTAGYPMLQVLEAQDIRQVLISSVRYFGGIKLGKGGLIRAYTKSCQLALEESGLKEVLRVQKYRLSYDYSHHGSLDYILAKEEVLGLEPLYSEYVTRDIYLQDQGPLIEIRNATDARVEELYLGSFYLDPANKIEELEEIIE